MLAGRRKDISPNLQTAFELGEMKFSVVIAAYNASNTIRATLQSCLSQTFAAFEIIVVNDASTDDTASIIQACSSSITLISFIENKGVSAARNAGWAEASGDYVTFLDSDDIWHPEKLFWINESLKGNSKAHFMAHQYTVDSSVINSRFTKPNEKSISFSNLLIRNQIQGSCIVIKGDLKIRFDESMRHCEDYDLALRCAYQEDILFLEVPLSILSRPQQSQGGLSANTWAMRKGELYAFSKLNQLHPLLGIVTLALYVYSLGKHLLQKLK